MLSSVSSMSIRMGGGSRRSLKNGRDAAILHLEKSHINGKSSHVKSHLPSVKIFIDANHTLFGICFKMNFWEKTEAQRKRARPPAADGGQRAPSAWRSVTSSPCLPVCLKVSTREKPHLFMTARHLQSWQAAGPA